MNNKRNNLNKASSTLESYSSTNIQGISFKKTNLSRANFCNAKAGLGLMSKLKLILFCLLACLISEMMIFWLGITIIRIVTNQSIISGLVLFFLFLGFTISTFVYDNFKNSLVYFILIPTSLILLLSVILPNQNIKTHSVPILMGLVINIGTIGAFTSLSESYIVLETAIAYAQKLLFYVIFIVSIIGGVFIVFLTGSYKDFPSNPEIIITSLLMTILLTALAIYISWRSQRGDPKYRALRAFAITICSTRGTNFQEANLTDASFAGATIGNTNFTKANLTRTCWLGAKHLDKARVEGTYLENERIRQLLVTGDGRDQNFDGLDLRGCNLRNADLSNASFINAKLSEATLEGANLTRAKLVKAQLYGTNLTNAILTGACIQDWAISLDTQLEGIRCEYVYMRLESKEDPDPWRKPDNRNETFKDGDFTDFIAPIIKTQKLYQTQNIDLRIVAENYTILDIFHHQGVDPSASAIAFQKLIEKYPEAGLKVLSIEGRGNEKIHFQAQVTDEVNRSLLSQEYKEIYNQIKSGSYENLLALLGGVNERDKQIQQLHQLLANATQQPRFYVETTRHINIGQGDYRETSVNEQGRYVEGDINQDVPEEES